MSEKSAVREGGLETILIRGKPCVAERVYESSRGDYVAYMYQGKHYAIHAARATGSEPQQDPAQEGLGL